MKETARCCKMDGMAIIRTEGIVLHTLKFRDYDQIVTFFTADAGLLKAVVKGALHSKKGKGALTAPLTQAEFLYTAGRGDLHTCVEITPLRYRHELRASLDTLEAAMEILQALYTSQLPQKPSPNLYQLLVSYLDKLPAFTAPAALAASFRLKILHHDGVLHLNDSCSACGTPLTQLHIAEGECFCPTHTPLYGIAFTPDESVQLMKLSYARNFSLMAEEPATSEFSDKVRRLFNNR